MKIAVAGGSGVVGRHVVDVAGSRGHEIDVLTRSGGTDLTTGSGLTERLRGVEAVIDVASTTTMTTKGARDFFRSVTRNLLQAGRSAGVGHHVALSIIGAADAPFGYYAGKALQEEMVLAAEQGTVVRAAQFHEFAEQTLSRTKVGPVHLMPLMRSQPVAAREVAELLVDVAVERPLGRGPEIAGPEVLRVAEMARAHLRRAGRPARVLEVALPGGFGRAMRDGTLLAGPAAHLGRQTYGEWLEHGVGDGQ